MGLNDCKLNETFFSEKGIIALSDTPSANGMTAAELKAAFDDLSKNYVGQSLNDVIDILVAEGGAGQIGTTISTSSGKNVQAVLDNISANLASINTNLTAHESSSANPHNVSPSQIGAVAKSELTESVVNDNSKVPTSKAVYEQWLETKSHIDNTNNPHEVSTSQIGAVSVDSLSDTVVNDESLVPTSKAVYEAIVSVGGGASGGGDMFKAIYDSTNKLTDIFAYADNAANNAKAAAQTYAEDYAESYVQSYAESYVASSVSSHNSAADAHSSLFQAKAERKLWNGTISASWSGSAAPYTQSISLSGILATDTPHITPVFSTNNDTAIAEMEAWSLINRASAGDGSIVFSCFTKKPAVAINIQIEVIR